MSHGPVALILIVDPELAPASAEEQLRVFYVLTR
jgi:hypothetical protein